MTKSLNFKILTNKILVEKQSCLVSGLAGTGKSTLLKDIVKHLKTTEYKLNTHVVAPTAIAAISAKGMTTYTWLGLGLADKDVTFYLHRLHKYPITTFNLTNTEYLVIDEISMFDAEMFVKIDILARHVRKNKNPFGGIILVMFGDFCQLKSIQKVKTDIKFVFQTTLWKKMNIYRMWLRKNYRQGNDLQYANLLNRVRKGKITLQDIKLLRSKVVYKFNNNAIPVDEYGDVTITPPLLTTHKNSVKEYNINKLNYISTTNDFPIFTFRPKIATKRDEESEILPEFNKYSDTLHEKFPVYNVRVCQNTQVMMRCNIMIGCGIVNGTLGIISRLTDHSIYIRFMVDGVLMPAIRLKKYRFVLKINGGKIYMDQYPISLAYACTIHKSQSISLDSAIVDISRCFADSMVYVALSRIRSLDGLILKGMFDTRWFCSDKDALEFERDEQLVALVSGCTKNVEQSDDCAIHTVWKESEIADPNIFSIINEFM
jgi:GTPase SAR1 family protein